MKNILSICLLLWSFSAVPAFADAAVAAKKSMETRIPKIVELKDAGLVGEKADGLLGVIRDERGASELVQSENKDRLIIYKQRAATQGHTLATFMKVMGEEFTKQEKAGRMIQDATGNWVKK